MRFAALGREAGLRRRALVRATEEEHTTGRPPALSPGSDELFRSVRTAAGAENIEVRAKQCGARVEAIEPVTGVVAYIQREAAAHPAYPVPECKQVGRQRVGQIVAPREPDESAPNDSPARPSKVSWPLAAKLPAASACSCIRPNARQTLSGVMISKGIVRCRITPVAVCLIASIMVCTS